MENFEFSAFWDWKVVSRGCKMMVFAHVFLQSAFEYSHRHVHCIGLNIEGGQGVFSQPPEHFRRYYWGWLLREGE